MESIVLSNMEKLFKENLEKNIFGDLEIKNIHLIEKQEFKGNLTPLISCSEDVYEDLLKVYETCEKVLEIDSDRHLEIIGSGILYLIINRNCNLFLDIKSEKFEGIFIKILVQNNIKLNLINYNCGKELFTKIKIIQETNSKVNHLIFNVNNKQNINENKLYKDTNYEFEGINYSNRNESQNQQINFNKINHFGDNSNSDFKVNCYSFNNSDIICKTKTRIEKSTKNCIGHQKAQGLILSRTSKINCEPILEILSNDVISSHSASVSKIFDDTKYYLQTRGLSEEEIKDFIVKERFNYLIEKIEIKEFKEILFEEINKI